MKKLQVDIDPKTALDMSAAVNELRRAIPKHDARLMSLALLDRAAHLFSQLKAMNMETDSSIDGLFAAALTRAKTAPARAPQVTASGGLEASKVAS
jgi:superfamily I DNA/RNA helicase